MVNFGPSKGCLTCKRRRIKCDGVKPICQRCRHSRRLCLGYTNDGKMGVREDASVVSDRLPAPALPEVGSWCMSTSSKVVSPRTSETVEPTRDSILSRCLRALHATSQSVEERIDLHQQYQSALRELNRSISMNAMDSWSSALSFALYEMMVDNGEESAWQVHLDGFLAMLGHRALELKSQRLSVIRKALYLIKDEDSVYAAAAAADGNMTLLLDIIKLRLRHQTSQMQRLLCTSGKPRKLDVQKQSTDLKRLYRNASSILPMLGHTKIGRERLWRIELITILVVTSDLILQTDEMLGSARSRSTTRQHQDLLVMTETLADEIHTGAGLMLFSTRASEGVVDTHAMVWLWPLYAASVARHLDQQRVQALQKILYKIAEEKKIPAAAHLASVSSSVVGYDEITAGLLLVSVAVGCSDEISL